MDLKTAHTRIAEENGPGNEVYGTVVRRGRRRRRARAVLGTGLVAAVLGLSALAGANSGTTGVAQEPKGDTPTTVAEEPSATEPEEEEPAPEPTLESGSVSLRPADWQESVDSGQPNAAQGAGYVVTDAEGIEVIVGSLGTFGEAIITVPPGRYMFTVATLEDGTECGFETTVDISAEDRARPVELRCG